MSVLPNKYIQFQDGLLMKNANPSIASWNIVGPARGSTGMSLRTRHPLFFGAAVQYGVASTYTCGGTTNVNVALGSATLWQLTPAMQYFGGPGNPSGWSSGNPQTNNIVFIQSMVASQSSSLLTVGCGAASSYSGGLTNTSTSLWVLVPPLACSAVCNTFTFSLASVSNVGQFLYVNSAGAVKVGRASAGTTYSASGDAGGAADFTSVAASFTGIRTLTNGVPGWVIMTTVGTVLTLNEGVSAGCGGFTSISANFPNASGITEAQTWYMNWEDGGSLYRDIGGVSNIAKLPNNTAAYAALNCVASITATASYTPTSSNTPSKTPTVTTTATTTASNTPSPSASSQYATGCPASFGVSHYPNVQSITAANDTNAFLRHCECVCVCVKCSTAPNDMCVCVRVYCREKVRLRLSSVCDT